MSKTIVLPVMSCQPHANNSNSILAKVPTNNNSYCTFTYYQLLLDPNQHGETLRKHNSTRFIAQLRTWLLLPQLLSPTPQLRR